MSKYVCIAAHISIDELKNRAPYGNQPCRTESPSNDLAAGSGETSTGGLRSDGLLCQLGSAGWHSCQTLVIAFRHPSGVSATASLETELSVPLSGRYLRTKKGKDRTFRPLQYPVKQGENCHEHIRSSLQLSLVSPYTLDVLSIAF